MLPFIKLVHCIGAAVQRTLWCDGNSMVTWRCRVRWETNLTKGVCGVSFDRQDIAMNKFAAACLESHCHFFDARTQHPKTGKHQISLLEPKAERDF